MGRRLLVGQHGGCPVAGQSGERHGPRSFGGPEGRCFTEVVRQLGRPFLDRRRARQILEHLADAAVDLGPAAPTDPERQGVAHQRMGELPATGDQPCLLGFIEGVEDGHRFGWQGGGEGGDVTGHADEGRRLERLPAGGAEAPEAAGDHRPDAVGDTGQRPARVRPAGPAR